MGVGGGRYTQIAGRLARLVPKSCDAAAMPSRPALALIDVARFAAAQAGAVGRKQLLAIGYTDSMIRANTAGRRWRRMFPGVYNTVTGIPAFRSWLWAAYLYAGSNSNLHGRTALAAWRLEPASWPLHIAIPTHRRLDRAPAELVVHRQLEGRPVYTPNGCPPTAAVEHALLEAVATTQDAQAVMSQVTAVCQQRRSTIPALELAVQGSRQLRHRSLVVSLIAEMRDGATTVLEIPAMHKIFRAHGLPTGRGQVSERQHGSTVVRDRVIEEYGLVIEFDGRLGHDDPRGRLRDHRRDNAVALSGRTTLRFGWVDVHNEACESAAQIAAVLRSRGWAGTVQSCGRGCLIR